MLALMGATLWVGHAEAKAYKGAEVYSQSQYQFGRVEVRMRLARGAGILSTFFTYRPGSEMAGVQWEEIDIEAFGKGNAMSWQSNILTGNPRTSSEMVHQVAAPLSDAYHTFTIEWTPTTVTWLVDGTEARKTTGGQASLLTHPHVFHFNLWASDVGSWAGDFDNGVLPQAQYVNWIKYYRYDNGAFALDWSDDFNTFDTTRWSKADWTFDGNLVDFVPDNAIVKDGTLVLCMTAEAQTGCSGAVPADSAGGLGGSGGGGAGGASGGGTAGASSAGAGGSPLGGAGGAAGSSGSAGSTALGGASAMAGASAGGAAGANTLAGAGGILAGGGTTAGGAPGAAGGQSAGSGPVTPTGGALTSGNGDATTPGQPTGETGCGCAVAGGSSAPQSALWLAGALLLRARSLRKRARARQHRK